MKPAGANLLEYVGHAWPELDRKDISSLEILFIFLSPSPDTTFFVHIYFYSARSLQHQQV